MEINYEELESFFNELESIFRDLRFYCLDEANTKYPDIGRRKVVGALETMAGVMFNKLSMEASSLRISEEKEP